jgi:zinc transporter
MASQNAAVAQAMRALAQKLDAIDHEFGSLQERARLLLEEVAAKMTEITNRRLFTLSMLTACLLPPTLVTGFFGMNTKDMPFQNSDGGTWVALAVAAVASTFSYWALRRMRAF